MQIVSSGRQGSKGDRVKPLFKYGFCVYGSVNKQWGGYALFEELAELMEEYTVVLSRVLEDLFYQAPFPRRIRVLILRSLPFVSSSPPLLLLPAPAS
ncbi:hypothetical protein GQ457_11G032030 [Hibiscus cannabinus]